MKPLTARRRTALLVAGLFALGTLGTEVAPRVAAGPPGLPSAVVPVEPTRILDTRLGIGAPAEKLWSGQSVRLPVAGVAGVPANASGVVINLTVTAVEGSGYVTAYPGGGERPTASVINYSAGEDIANMITAQLGADGTLELFNDQGGVHLLADVAGYLLPGGSGGTAGLPGPQGPQGVQGPAGPQGPGPDVVDIDVPADGTRVEIGTWEGVTVATYCYVTQGMSIAFDTTPTSGGLRMGGVRSEASGTDVVGISGGAGVTFVAVTGTRHLSSTVQNEVAGGRILQVQLTTTAGSPCRIWGWVLPLG